MRSKLICTTQSSALRTRLNVYSHYHHILIRMTWVINKHSTETEQNLIFRGRANAENPVPGSLRLIGNNRKLLTHHLIGKSTLPHIRLPHNRNKAAPMIRVIRLSGQLTQFLHLVQHRHVPVRLDAQRQQGGGLVIVNFTIKIEVSSRIEPSAIPFLLFFRRESRRVISSGSIASFGGEIGSDGWPFVVGEVSVLEMVEKRVWVMEPGWRRERNDVVRERRW